LGRGVFGYRTEYNFSAIEDGTSNTALYSERCLSVVTRSDSSNRYGNLKVKESGVYNYAGPSGDPIWTGTFENSYVSNRNGCLDTRKGSDYRTDLGIADPGGYDGWAGCNYTEGHFWSTGFHTVLPPNGPQCISRNNMEQTITAPSSKHTGGVQLALADGAVRFISETIDVGTAKTTPRNRASQYAVWGGLGSRNGGEAVSLP
jgi:hypothetical protein